MFKKPFIWRCLLMPGSIAGWMFAASGVWLQFDGPLRVAWITVVLIWTILHPLEIAVSYRIGKEKGLSALRVVVMTILFGFTWWLPLKLGIIER